MICIDIQGTPHVLESERQVNFDVLAKLDTFHFVMASNDGNLYNPSDINDNLNKKDNERGKPFWNLTRCSQNCYEQYVTFLRSKNRTPYTIAQRRFRNDL